MNTSKDRDGVEIDSGTDRRNRAYGFGRLTGCMLQRRTVDFVKLISS